MKLFKSIDEKLAACGYIKTREDKWICSYKRYNETLGFQQNVDLIHKRSGLHILQSYDPKLSDPEGIGSTCVGVSYQSLKLFMKKFHKLLRTTWKERNYYYD